MHTLTMKKIEGIGIEIGTDKGRDKGIGIGREKEKEKNMIIMIGGKGIEGGKERIIGK